MKQFIPLLLIAVLSIGFSSDKQEKKVVNATLSAEELKLYNLIMAYRKTKKLPLIPLSKSLTFVAQTHSKDLVINRPGSGNCNSHSWSNKGKWKPMCYTDDHAKAELMWSKPRELTNYTGDGFEIACYQADDMTAKDALECWQGSEHHNDVILNKNIWKEQTWKSIGIGIYKNYVTVWFGSQTDPDGAPKKPGTN